MTKKQPQEEINANKEARRLEKEKEHLQKFIDQCEELHPGKICFSKTKYNGRKELSIFICKGCGNEYERTPDNMLRGRGHGCTDCNGGVRDTKEIFIKKATTKHVTKFRYHLVEYVNAHTPVNIECVKNNHIFQQTPYHHIQGDGCPYCAGKYRTLDDFKKFSSEKYPDKNYVFIESTFVNMSTPMSMICPEGHPFTIPPSRHILEDSKGGCTTCANIATSERNSYTQDEWILLAEKKHNGFYTYLKVIYRGSSYYVIITCPTHGDFPQKPTSHLSGAGCRDCGIDKIIQSKVYTDEDKEMILDQVSELHKNQYKYGKIYRDENGRLMIEVICKKHGLFPQRLDHHRNGHGCSSCISQYSKGQIEWLKFCEVRDGAIEHAENIGEYKIPDSMYTVDGRQMFKVYEYQGDFWHGNPKRFCPTDINPRTNTSYMYLFDKTIKKIEFLKNKGYEVCTMWEFDWKRAKNALIKIQRKWRANK